MANDWINVQLQDVVSKLGDGLHGTPKYSENGEYYFINGNNLENGQIIFKEKTKRVDHTQYLKYKKELNERTLLVSINGTIGNVAYYNGEKVILGKSACYFNLKDDIDKGYVRYVLSGHYFQSYLKAFATGTTIQNVSLKSMREFSFPLPPIKEQKAIAHILGSLDDKIELNRLMNETLEAMAQALFKSWFVDFVPVIDNALAAGNAIPDELLEHAEQRKGIEKKDDTDIQSLFPGEFEFTEEMGWIPKGWEVKESGDLFDVRDGTHDSPKKSDEGKYLITSRHITSGVIDYPNAYLISQDDFHEVNKRSLVESYDILITMIGTVGVSMLVLQDEIDFAIKNVGLFKTSNNKSYAVFFYLYLNSNYMTQFLDSRLAGTTQKYLTLKVLRALPVVTPDNKTLSHFVNNMSPIFKKIHSNHEQIGTLSKLRDTLLPKLMSGELRISDAAELVDEAV